MVLELLDETTLDQLKSLSSTPNGLLLEVTTLFSDLAPKAFQDMQFACDEANWKSLAFLAHSLKSSSGSIGAHAVCITCGKIEDASNALDEATCRREMAALNPIIIATLQALEKLRVSLETPSPTKSA